MRPPGFNQPNVQSNQGNQSRYQGNNFNSNQNRGNNFSQNHQNNQGQVFQPPTNQPPVYQVPTYQAPTPQIQGVSKTDFENYVKANDAVLKNVQNQGQNLQNQMANVTSLLTSLCDNFKNSASTSNSGTLPSQTVTNPRQQINAITTRSGKTLEEPSTPLVPTPDVSNPQKEPEQNPETSTENALVEMPKFNKWLSSLLRNKEKLEEISIRQLNRTSALADSEASINLLPHSIYKKLGLEALTPTRMTLELANRSITHPMGIAEDVVVRVDETLTLRVGKEELVYYADKSKKNKEKNFVHAISIIDFSKDDPFSWQSNDYSPPSSSPMKTSDNFEKFTDELTPLDSLPPDKVFFFFTLTSPEEVEFEAYLERDSIPPRINLTLPPALKVSSSNPTSPTLTGEKIICLLATYLHKKPKLLSRPQEVEEIKEKEDEVSSDVPIHTIVMPIRITFDNPIDFNDHFSKPKDFKKDLTILFDSSESSILPSPLLASDSPFTAELSASVTLNSLRNEDKVFKPGILVYHAIHDKNLVTLEENLKENISSGTLLVFKEPSFLLPPPKPPDECLNFEPILVIKNVVLNGDFYQSKKTLPLNIEDVNSFTFIIWTFLPHFTYTEESPLIFSFRSENFVFDPGIITFHNPVDQPNNF
ncbi:reverse transcriptase domain-containing protein [Tanacetum coccineum]